MPPRLICYTATSAYFTANLGVRPWQSRYHPRTPGNCSGFPGSALIPCSVPDSPLTYSAPLIKASQLCAYAEHATPRPPSARQQRGPQPAHSAAPPGSFARPPLGAPTPEPLSSKTSQGPDCRPHSPHNGLVWRFAGRLGARPAPDLAKPLGRPRPGGRHRRRF
ncbi:MAG: hypothetical protein J3K34DRAFT_414508 [Monoraphidium minutum]|nr:MAG: hypothetical protein J3K34DRAFT_414508 [Monoraphidium minutum]